jgi:peroxiredoxin
MASTAAFHRTLVPGQLFPDVRLPKLSGGELALRPSAGATKPRIIVVYRGAFCPFCRVRGGRGRGCPR